jgi:hypothetical protein
MSQGQRDLILCLLHRFYQGNCKNQATKDWMEAKKVVRYLKGTI